MQLKNGEFCPLIKKQCVQMQCAWFTCLRGTNPNTGQEIDDWRCAITALPLLQVEVAKEVRQGAAATESFRNETVKANATFAPMLQAIATGSGPRLIEN